MDSGKTNEALMFYFAGLVHGDGHVGEKYFVVWLKIHDGYELLFEFSNMLNARFFVPTYRYSLMSAIRGKTADFLKYAKTADYIAGLDDDNFIHFLRGLIDADGCFSITKARKRDKIYLRHQILITSGNIEVLRIIQSKLKRFEINSVICKSKPGSFNLYIVNSDVKKIIDLLYKNRGPCLGRKFARAWAVFLSAVSPNNRISDLVVKRFLRYGF